MDKQGFVLLASMVVSVVLPVAAWAKVPATQADQLGKTLTCMGSEKAASKDGLIPEWTGKWEGAPPYINYTQADANVGKSYPDAYPKETPLYAITARNVAKYKSHLTVGQMALFKKYPTYRMLVYKSHRDWRYPSYVCKYSLYNALHATIGDPHYGNIVDGELGSVPFPIATNGIEMLDDVLMPVRTITAKQYTDAFDVLPDGTKVHGRVRTWNLGLLNMPQNRGKPFKGTMTYSMTETLLPLRSQGNASVSAEPLDHRNPRLAWAYNVGTRRVSQVPVFGFDQPLAGTDGAMTIDSSRMFNGSPVRYNWKLLGEREIYMPADDYKLQEKSTKYDDLLTPHFPNPKYIRWELQRVYILEATLRPGYRHIYHKRILFINQDNHMALMTDLYDEQGRLWQVGFDANYWAYNAHMYEPSGEFFMDLLSGGYVANGLTSGAPRGPILNKPDSLTPSMFSPQMLQSLSNS